MNYSKMVTFFCLAVASVFSGCTSSMVVCGAYPDDPLGQANWRNCAERNERENDEEKARQAQGEARQAQAQADVLAEEQARQETLEVRARWQREVEEANLEATSLSPKYPRLAWLNGIWCDTNQFRWQVVGPDQLVQKIFYPMTTYSSARIGDIYYTINEEEDTFELQREYNDEYGPVLGIYRIRKDSDNQYTQISESERNLNTGILNKERDESITYKRCFPGQPEAAAIQAEAREAAAKRWKAGEAAREEGRARKAAAHQDALRARWEREVEEANLESRSSSPKYPRLAWLNGIWCEDDPRYTFPPWRWQVVGPNLLRKVTYYEKKNISTNDFPIEEKNGYYEILTRRSGNGNYSIKRIRKDSDTQYTRIYVAYFDNGKKKWDHEELQKYERCWIQ